MAAKPMMTLPRPERLFLWAIRAWSAHHSDLTAIWWSLDRAFTEEGIPEALAPFHESMSSIFGGFTRWPDIRCVNCSRLGEDEALILGALTCLQQDRAQQARRLLEELVSPNTARAVCRGAATFARLAHEGGLHLTHALPGEGAPYCRSGVKAEFTDVRL